MRPLSGPAIPFRALAAPQMSMEAAARLSSDPPVVLRICVTCGSAQGAEPAGARLLAALRATEAAQTSSLDVRPVQCLSVCNRPCTVALSGRDRYTYVFGDLDPDRDISALIACARSYATQEHGFLLWRERPEVLRKGIVARIPPLGWESEDGRHPR